jgi:hypothetical protein
MRRPADRLAVSWTCDSSVFAGKGLPDGRAHKALVLQGATTDKLRFLCLTGGFMLRRVGHGRVFCICGPWWNRAGEAVSTVQPAMMCFGHVERVPADIQQAPTLSCVSD